MIGLHLLLLGFSWVFFVLAESVFPRAHPSLDLSDHWLTYLLFRPIPFLLSGLFFLFAILMLRFIIRFHSTSVLRLGSFKQDALLGFIPFLVGLFILGYEARMHLIPTVSVSSVICLYDGVVFYLKMRRIKRLKMAFRQFVPK